MKRGLILFLLLMASVLGAAALKPQQMLQLGPVTIEEPLNPGDDFFNYCQLSPEINRQVMIFNRYYRWENGTEKINFRGKKALLLLAVYLQPEEFTRADLLSEPGMRLKVFLNGNEVKAEKSEQQQKFTFFLKRERQLLLLQILLEKKEEKIADYQLSFELDFQPRVECKQLLSFRQRPLGLDDILYQKNVTNLNISPDGTALSLQLTGVERDGRMLNEWQFYRLPGMEKLAAFDQLRFVAWAGNSEFIFLQRKENENLCATYNLQSGEKRILFQTTARIGFIHYSRSGGFLVYQLFKEDQQEKAVYRYVRNPEERTKLPSAESKIVIFYPQGGFRKELTDYERNLDNLKISPDGKKLLIVYNRTISERPFSENCYFLFDLTIFQKELLFSDPWVNDYQWSPDSKQLLFLGGPSAFNNAGNVLPPETIPNDFDTQAYLYDLAARKVEAISRSFDPSIVAAFWTEKDRIYFRVYDRDRIVFYRYSLKAKNFSLINLPFDAISLATLSGDQGVIWASSPNQPPALYRVRLGSEASSFLKSFDQQLRDEIIYGKIEPLRLKITEGREMTGFLYYPPDFRPEKKYPLIVYYYGGTLPVSRDFGGRYPKEWYAAQGYLVVVFQPTGTVGWGQRSSAVHVNDWGEVTSEEIIRATKVLCDQYNFIDRNALGAMGASYGGFLTQFLATKTDLFTAFISHAGISALTSYWGGGDWGYTYSAVASAESYPWNRKDLYVGHSPLYMAERITRPLLLLHGSEDNNVPPLESYQMYLALKILKKDVALITFKNQQHFILGLEQRRQWLQTIIAWFDRYLKKKPFYWEKIYPEGKQ